jgi:hypothetical protein
MNPYNLYPIPMMNVCTSTTNLYYLNSQVFINTWATFTQNNTTNFNSSLWRFHLVAIPTPCCLNQLLSPRNSHVLYFPTTAQHMTKPQPIIALILHTVSKILPLGWLQQAHTSFGAQYPIFTSWPPLYGLVATTPLHIRTLLESFEQFQLPPHLVFWFDLPPSLLQ